jgi:hypothetical protein
MLETLKNHYGKIFSGITGTIIFTIAGYWFSDARYVHTKDLEKQNIELRQELDSIHKQLSEIKHK